MCAAWRGNVNRVRALTVAPLLGPLGRGLALFVADFEVSECFHK